MTDELNPGGLPADYDRAKEPIARYRLHKAREYRPMSGHGYVVALLDGESVGGQVIIASASNCDHCTTICDGRTPDTKSLCVVEWQYDYSILWSRTAGGRRLISSVGTQADKHQNPDHPAIKFLQRVNEADKPE